MNLTFKIAKRYLFGKKSTNAINLITWISILGMGIGTAALILILSVFNGFEGILGNLLQSYNPDLKITPLKGLYLDLDDARLKKIGEIAGIESYSRVLEEVSLFEYDGSQEAGYIKGVDSNYVLTTDIKSTITLGEYLLENESNYFGIIGNGMYNKLSINSSDPLTPITVYMPARQSKGPLASPFKVLDLYPSGVFSVGGEEDGQYIITSLSFVESLLDRKGKPNGLEIKMSGNGNEKKIREALSSILGNNIAIKNRYQQNEAFLKIMNIEKWISYLIAVLTLAIIAFNLVGSLWMIVLDKKKDISIIQSMGYTADRVKNIFRMLGVLVGFIGLLLGMFFSGVLYFLQKRFDLVAVPDGFLIDAYPIEMRFGDLLLVFCTVISISFLASLLPAARAGRISSFVRQE